MSKSLYADPTMMDRSPAEMAKLLAPYLRIKEPEIQERLSQDTAFVWLDRTMDHENYEGLEELIKNEKIKGLRFVDESRRFYPNGTMAAQLIGFVGENDRGLDGIEMVLDDEIRGNIQKLRLTTDKNDIPIFESALQKILPDKERSVRLTIDSTIQYVAEKGLDGIVARNHPTGAAIIIMNPKTGEILAMASRPNFDPNEYSKGNPEQYKNRAVVNLYEPGSTFKPIMASAAIDSGKWTVDRVYRDIGYIDVDDRTIHNWDDSGMGNVTLKQIIMYSINTGMAKVGLTTGGPTLVEYAQKYGFGQPTGIELPGEGAGILFDPNTMTRLDTAVMAIGQGTAVTPLQMVQAFGGLANGGHMMKPFIVKEIDNSDGSIYKKNEPQEIGQPISEETSQTISKYMAEEVSSGGGQNAKIEGYEFCGKTGTAQRLNKEGTGYAEGQYIGSFVGFGPLKDPQFVVLIVVDNPSGSYYGAQVAAPVFKDIMTDVVRFKGIRPTVQANSQVTVNKELYPEHKLPEVQRSADGILVPSFSGWDSREVNDWLNTAGLGFVPTGIGHAVYQNPPAGTYAEPDSDVEVTFVR
jgi:cell division protein FtsI (penicillin-binding protein 3)/stage V sporulation protein D (sporulation-specific penicillin-binding protein)